VFGARFARRSLKRYRRKGLDEIEREMVDAAARPGLDGARVLEIGGGIGKLQAELLLAGAERGEVVELVAAFEPYAAELARSRGLEERTSFRVADLLDDPAATEPADVVLLNRVICCTPDGLELTGVAARLTRRRLALSFPRDRRAIRAAVALQNAFFRVVGRAFRVFVHEPAAIVAAGEAHGLRRVESGRGALWEYVVLERGA
jgi:magnesium-protoporphyrin O-methyltransferase